MGISQREQEFGRVVARTGSALTAVMAAGVAKSLPAGSTPERQQ